MSRPPTAPCGYIHGVSINVGSGETVTLLGTNGNGKIDADEMRDGDRAADQPGRIVAEIEGLGARPDRHADRADRRPRHRASA